MLRSVNSRYALILTAPLLLLACKQTGNVKVEAQESRAAPEVSTSSDSVLPVIIKSTFNRSVDGYMATILGESIFAGDLDQVRSLFEAGASFEDCLTDETYIFDALYASIAFGKVEILEYVLASKSFSDINKAYTEESETPLTLACSLQDHQIANRMADLLISNGANVNGVGESGGEETKTPLFESIKRANIPLVKLLVEKGAKKDVTTTSGQTALSMAEELGSTELVELLK